MEAVTHGQPACLSAAKEKQAPSGRFLRPAAARVCGCLGGLEGARLRGGALPRRLPALGASSRCGDARAADTISPHAASISKPSCRSGFPLGLWEPRARTSPNHTTAPAPLSPRLETVRGLGGRVSVAGGLQGWCL